MPTDSDKPLELVTRNLSVVKFIWLFFLSLKLGATTFQLQPIERQIRESDGILVGHFLRSAPVELENGSIATQMVFKITQEIGLQNELLGLNEVIIHYPGGSLNGRTYKVEGVPDFIPGEKAALLIRNIDNRFWGMNLGYGSYKIINYGPRTMLVNSLFPDHPKVGQIRLESFEESIKEIKGARLKLVPANGHVTEDHDYQRSPASAQAKDYKRSMASNDENSDHDGTQPSNMFWLITVLGATGGLFRLLRFKS